MFRGSEFCIKHIIMVKLFFLLSSFILLFACRGQQSFVPSDINVDSVGGPFENKAYTLILKPAILMAYDTSPGWNQQGEKILITGTIFKQDGITPAPGIELYYYQTNVAGRYIHIPGMARSMVPNTLGQTHGYIRGWVQTDSLGKYYIYTVRPGNYPDEPTPQHIHLTITEPLKKITYYIDDVFFDDDKFLTTSIRKNAENRGGNGIVQLKPKNGIATGERNITLGLNIPNYTK